jgi:hypothetical protein
MGNHCIDCKFCGKDQRVYGDTCCKEYQDAKAKEEADRKAEFEAEETYLARFGLDVHDSSGLGVGKVYAKDVVAMLKKREGKILKPGRPKKKAPPADFDW